MRTATNETRRKLATSLNGSTANAWATANDVHPVDVSDCRHNKPMSARRENRLRAALGLPPLRWQVVELLEGQRVVTIAPPRRTVRRAMSMTPERAASLDAEAQDRGYRSVGAWALAELSRIAGID